MACRVGFHKKPGPNIRLSPGMPAEVFIKTAERTALEYVLQPLTNSLRQAFRES